VKPMLEDLVKHHGLEARLASVRCTELSVLEIEEDPGAAERKLTAEARRALAEDGAEAILLAAPAWARWTKHASRARSAGHRASGPPSRSPNHYFPLRGDDEQGAAFKTPERRSIWVTRSWDPSPGSRSFGAPVTSPKLAASEPRTSRSGDCAATGWTSNHRPMAIRAAQYAQQHPAALTVSGAAHICPATTLSSYARVTGEPGNLRVNRDRP